MEEKIYNIGDIGKKICLITDLHYSEDYDLSILDRIEASIIKHKPDFICLSGDIIDYGKMIYSNSIKYLNNCQ